MSFKRKKESGQGMVEFALILPLLLILILGVFDFGRAFYSYLTFEHAGREAARYASIGADGGDINKIKEKAVDASNGLVSTIDKVDVSYSEDPVTKYKYVTVKFVDVSMDFYTPVLIALNPFSFPNQSTTMRVEGT